MLRVWPNKCFLPVFSLYCLNVHTVTWDYCPLSVWTQHSTLGNLFQITTTISSSCLICLMLDLFNQWILSDQLHRLISGCSNILDKTYQFPKPDTKIPLIWIILDPVMKFSQSWNSLEDRNKQGLKRMLFNETRQYKIQMFDKTIFLK